MDVQQTLDLGLIDHGRTSETIEQWKTISSFPAYQCSTLGRFRSHKRRRLMKIRVTTNNYQVIGLTGTDGIQKTVLAHKLIAETWLVKPDANGFPLEVNHKNRIKTDNRMVNLEWVTRSENMRHVWATKRGKRQPLLNL
jgi:hypothetical protein